MITFFRYCWSKNSYF